MLAGTASLFSSAAPTGTFFWDRLLVFALVVVTVIAGSKARRWVVIVAATIAMACVGTSLWLVAASAGLACAITSALGDHRSRSLNALAIGLALQALLRLPEFGFFGLPSVVAAVTILMCWIGGYRMANARERRLARRTSLAVLLVTAAIGVMGASVLLDARADVEIGVSSARRGLQAARNADPESLLLELQTADASLQAASDKLDSIWAKPLRLLPVAAQHVRAADVVVQQGAGIANAGANVATEADLATLTLAAGRVDVSALAEMEPALSALALQLDGSAASIDDIRSPWLVPAFDRELDSVLDEIERVGPETAIAADAARVLPDMLGATAPRRYLVMFGTPAETREFGGLMGSWALIEARDGSLSTLEIGRASRLRSFASENGLDYSQFPPWFEVVHRPAQFPQNITGTPDAVVMAEAARELFDGVGGGSIDGVVYLDALVMVELIGLVAPLDVPWSDEPLTASAAADFLFDGQYRLDGTRNEQFEQAASLFQLALTKLRSTPLPGPEELGSVFGPVARGGHLQVVTFDAEENAFLEDLKLLRRFGIDEFISAEGGPLPATDQFAIVQANGSVSKLDLYLTREVAYDVTVDELGVLQGDVTVTLRSLIPDDPPSYVMGTNPGTNEALLNLYTPHQLLSAQLDGVVVEVQGTTEYGLNRYLVPVVLAGTSDHTVTFSIAGQVAVDRPYSLEIWHQPTVNRDQVAVSVTGEAGVVDTSLELFETTTLTAALHG